jgi:hypothetical protein
LRPALRRSGGTKGSPNGQATTERDENRGMVSLMNLELNNGIVAIIDDEDGLKISAYTWKAYWFKRSACYYITSHDGRKTIYLHRVIMSAQKGQVVDHRNRNTLDNRRDNLRLTIQQNNSFNTIGKGSNTGFKGVSYSKERRKFFASIMHNRKTIALGRFLTAEEAARAYDTAAIRLFGEFALLNFK